MAKRTKIQQHRLDEVENEFGPLLLACLKECSRGRWGLFGQNDQVDPDGRWLKWPEADRLKELAREIKSLRIENRRQKRDLRTVSRQLLAPGSQCAWGTQAGRCPIG